MRCGHKRFSYWGDILSEQKLASPMQFKKFWTKQILGGRLPILHRKKLKNISKTNWRVRLIWSILIRKDLNSIVSQIAQNYSRSLCGVWNSNGKKMNLLSRLSKLMLSQNNATKQLIVSWKSIISLNESNENPFSFTISYH